jgi:leucyl aminopeptidase
MPPYGAPVCSAVASFCDTASLLDGRGVVGPGERAEYHMGGSCADGSVGVYHQDESLDWLKVSTVDALPLAYGSERG